MSNEDYILSSYEADDNNNLMNYTLMRPTINIIVE